MKKIETTKWELNQCSATKCTDLSNFIQICLHLPKWCKQSYPCSRSTSRISVIYLLSSISSLPFLLLSFSHKNGNIPVISIEKTLLCPTLFLWPLYFLPPNFQTLGKNGTYLLLLCPPLIHLLTWFDFLLLLSTLHEITLIQSWEPNCTWSIQWHPRCSSWLHMEVYDNPSAILVSLNILS